MENVDMGHKKKGYILWGSTREVKSSSGVVFSETGGGLDFDVYAFTQSIVLVLGSIERRPPNLPTEVMSEGRILKEDIGQGY